jgi:hypothetical protein
MDYIEINTNDIVAITIASTADANKLFLEITIKNISKETIELTTVDSIYNLTITIYDDADSVILKLTDPDWNKLKKLASQNSYSSSYLLSDKLNADYIPQEIQQGIVIATLTIGSKVIYCSVPWKRK